VIDPLAAMQAACIAIGNGEAAEIELEWNDVTPDGIERRMTIYVRKTVKHFQLPPSTGGEVL
jgi:hypothetical protein